MADSGPLATTGSHVSRERTGIVTTTLRFIFEGPREHEAAEPYDELLNFDARGPLGLPEIGRAATKQDDGGWLLEIAFEGVVGDVAQGALLEYDIASVDSPIQTFPNFPLLKKKWHAVPYGEDKQFRGWQPTMPNPAGGESIANPFYGTDHFLEANSILRVTFLIKELPDALFQNICKIQDPQVPPGTQGVVRTTSGYTWLKKSVRCRFRGNVWEVELEYWQGKWAPDLYSPRD